VGGNTKESVRSFGLSVFEDIRIGMKGKILWKRKGKALHGEKMERRRDEFEGIF